MLQVVIDESGRGQENKPAFVLAGYISSERNWEAFTERWQRTLADKPSIEYLKGYEAYSLRGQFKWWTEEQRDKKLFKLIKLIHQFARLSVTLAVNGRAFDSLLRASKGSLRTIYPLAVSALATKVLSFHIDQRTHEKLDFIFDAGMLHAKVFEQAFNEMMLSLPKHATDLIGKRPHMEDDRKIQPLQAADLLASYLRQKLTSESHGNEFRNPVWDALSSSGSNLDASLTTKTLLDLRRRFERARKQTTSEKVTGN